MIRKNWWINRGVELSRKIAKKAIRDGIIKRTDCPVCGGKAEIVIENRYFPLEVSFFCKKHFKRKFFNGDGEKLYSFLKNNY